MKMINKAIIGLIVIFILFVIGVYITAQIVLSPEKVKTWIINNGTQTLNREVFLEDVSINVFPTIALNAKNLRIANLKNFSSKPLVQIPKIEIIIDFLSILTFSPVIESIHLIEPKLRYDINAQGKNSFDGLSEKTAPSDSTSTSSSLTSNTSSQEVVASIPIPVNLSEIKVEGAQIRYHDQFQGRELVLGNINQTIAVVLDKKLENIRLRGNLDITEIQIIDQKSGLRKGRINLSLWHDLQVSLPQEQLHIQQLALEVQDIAIQIQGEIGQLRQNPHLRLNFNADQMDLNSILKEIPAEIFPPIAQFSGKGKIGLKGTVDGKIAPNTMPNFQANLRLEDLTLTHLEIPAALDHLNGNLIITEKTLETKNLQFQLAQQPMALAVTFSQFQPVPQLEQFKLKGKVNLEQVMPLLQQFVAFPDDLSLQGTVNTDLEGKGLLDLQNPQAFQIKGTLKMEDGSLGMKMLPEPILGSVQLQINDDHATISLRVKMRDSDAALTGTLKNYLSAILPTVGNNKRMHIKATVKSKQLNLDPFLSVFETSVGEESKAETTPSGPSQTGESMKEFPALPKLDLNLTTQLKTIQSKRMIVKNVSSQIDMYSDIISADLKGQLFGGSVQNKMRINLQDTRHAEVMFNGDIRGVEINGLVARLNQEFSQKTLWGRALSDMSEALYGYSDLKLNGRTQGLPHTFLDNLSGELTLKSVQGKLTKIGLVKQLADTLKKISPSFSFQELLFQDLLLNAEIKDQQVLIKNWKLRTSGIGTLNISGRVGFNGKLDLSIANHLDQQSSQRLLGAGSALVNQLSQMLQLNLSDRFQFIPQDNQGRAILHYAVGGTLENPRFSLDSVRMAKGSQQEAGKKSKLKAKEEVLKAKAFAEKKRLETEAKLRIEKEKKRLESETKKKMIKETKKLENSLKKKAQDLLKGWGR